MAYKPAVEGIYNTIISLIKLKLRGFNPHQEEGKYIIEEEFNSMEKAQAEKLKIDNFLFGSMKQLEEKESFKKAQNNRTIRGLINKHKGKLIDKVVDDGSVINFLNKFSIYAKTEITETK